jgi:cytochrome bd-type quinol oxidase subunit 2
MTGPADMTNPTATPEAGSGEHADDAHGVERLHPPTQAVRARIGSLFFGNDRRYQMFQTIAGTTTANLISAGIIAAIAVAAGGLSISFSWSWHYYINVLIIVALISVVLFVLSAIFYHNSPDPGKPKPGWGESAAFGLYIGITQAIFWPFVITLIAAINIAFVHGNHK